MPGVPDDCKDCLRASFWDGTPQGKETKLAGNSAYEVGDEPEIAIMVIHDLLGWEFRNLRLLADYYAKEIGATVVVPDL